MSASSPKYSPTSVQFATATQGMSLAGLPRVCHARGPAHQDEEALEAGRARDGWHQPQGSHVYGPEHFTSPS